MAYFKLVFVPIFLSSLIITAHCGKSDESDGCGKPPETAEEETCCVPPQKNIWGDLSGTLNICYETVNKQGNGSGQSDQIEHLLECVFKLQKNFMTNDTNGQKINDKAILSRLETTLKAEPEWLKVVENAVKTCFSDEGKVNGTFKTVVCILKESSINCPGRKKSPYCTDVQDYLKNCNNLEDLKSLLDSQHDQHYQTLLPVDKLQESNTGGQSAGQPKPAGPPAGQPKPAGLPAGQPKPAGPPAGQPNLAGPIPG